MASLKHQILYCERVKNTKAYNEQHLRLKKHATEKGATRPKQRLPSKDTLEQYITHAVKFGQWCKDTYCCRHFADCKVHIQDYADFLTAKGLSAATIHTYLAGVCYIWEVPLGSIKKPSRYTAEATRSRGHKELDKRPDAKREASPRLYDFACCVGVRRKEYLRLRGDKFVKDESGYPCVLIKRGKGGKDQLQRVLPEDVSFVESYFDGSNNHVFSKDEMEKNKIDLHHLRALQAQRTYDFYFRRLEENPEYRKQLSNEIELRWKKYNKRPWNPRCLEGVYWLRGKNRKFAKENGLAISYDRLALMAVSVFHLAHWRTDVTVANYMLAL